ncbi:MAG: alkane 1-monooxygenase, partial [Gammaproteobacteria bacterium]|nr:alkane 1-monooxygenase [Gammaproteobacteria bacterium]
FEHVPELPSGYFGSYLIAYVPWLWYKIMDPRLLKLNHIQGDISKINMLDSKREKIEQKYSDLIAAV